MGAALKKKRKKETGAAERAASGCHLSSCGSETELHLPVSHGTVSHNTGTHPRASTGGNRHKARSIIIPIINADRRDLHLLREPACEAFARTFPPAVASLRGPSPPSLLPEQDTDLDRHGRVAVAAAAAGAHHHAARRLAPPPPGRRCPRGRAPPQRDAFWEGHRDAQPEATGDHDSTSFGVQGGDPQGAAAWEQLCAAHDALPHGQY